MKKINLVIILLIFIISACEQTGEVKQRGLKVVFPEISEPVQITDNCGEYMFASYHGINSWSRSQRYVTVLKIGIKNTLPTLEDPAILYNDLRDGRYFSVILNVHS